MQHYIVRMNAIGGVYTEEVKAASSVDAVRAVCQRMQISADRLLSVKEYSA